MAQASNMRPEWPRRTGARPASRSRSTSAAARSPPRGRGRPTSRATRSASTWSPAASLVARSTSSRIKRALTVRARSLSAPPLFTFPLATPALVTPTLCIRGVAPRPSPCLATTRYLPSRRSPRRRPTPMTIPRTQEMRKRESHTRGVSPGVLCVVLVKTKSMTKSESVSDPMILTTPLPPPDTAQAACGGERCIHFSVKIV